MHKILNRWIRFLSFSYKTKMLTSAKRLKTGVYFAAGGYLRSHVIHQKETQVQTQNKRTDLLKVCHFLKLLFASKSYASCFFPLPILLLQYLIGFIRLFNILFTPNNPLRPLHAWFSSIIHIGESWRYIKEKPDSDRLRPSKALLRCASNDNRSNRSINELRSSSPKL